MVFLFVLALYCVASLVVVLTIGFALYESLTNEG
jgi:hypothetical protein